VTLIGPCAAPTSRAQDVRIAPEAAILTSAWQRNGTEHVRYAQACTVPVTRIKPSADQRLFRPGGLQDDLPRRSARSPSIPGSDPDKKAVVGLRVTTGRHRITSMSSEE
jgi:hypothetical protein